MPIMILLVLPWAANMEVKNIRLSFVDNDHSAYSDRLLQKLISSGYFSLTNISASNNEALKSIEADNADIILEIQADFEKDLIKTGTANVFISANAQNGNKAGLASSYLAAIVRDYAGELIKETNKTAISINPQFMFNQRLDYKVFIIPALMVMLLTLLAGFLPALNIVSEKEIGTIEQINVTPVKKITFILSKLIPYWIIGFIVLSNCLGIAALIYGLYPVGSLATIYLYASVYILVVSGLGLIISNYSATMQQAMFVMFFFILIFILMSGLFTPIDSMPQWAQTIAAFNPLKYFMQVMRAVYLKGSGINELTNQLVTLCAFAVFFNIWAVISYSKNK
jgi:ABC-2 type transport system permease protein